MELVSVCCLITVRKNCVKINFIGPNFSDIGTVFRYVCGSRKQSAIWDEFDWRRKMGEFRDDMAIAKSIHGRKMKFTAEMIQEGHNCQIAATGKRSKPLFSGKEISPFALFSLLGDDD